MTVFGAYARYYDLLYAEKDYAGEAAYVDRLMRDVRGSIASVLDLGCGTGLHAARLADKGYEVVGVDLSETMLQSAARRVGDRVRLLHGDIGTIRVGRTFDAVVSLFHVINYQTGQRQLRNAFANARAHLERGGVFVFDCWYGPAVLTERPEPRTRHLQDDAIEVTRHAEPAMRPNDNSVDVHYRVRILDKATGIEEEVEETHHMRYLFMPEILDF
ncbi:MAG TPA: class I SAM-dependent methyltransferase, partial [Vicinamibacterales bacterium]|nr:class I SAM-dependent methyltransferase [Vicinamibacterales bacterium]